MRPEILFSRAHQIASIVEGGLLAMLYVTLTTPFTSWIISPAMLVRISYGSCVGVAVLASILSQQRSSICRPKSRLPSRIPVTRSSWSGEKRLKGSQEKRPNGGHLDY